MCAAGRQPRAVPAMLAQQKCTWRRMASRSSSHAAFLILLSLRPPLDCKLSRMASTRLVVGCVHSYIHHSGRQALHTTHDAMLRVLPPCWRSHGVRAFSRGRLFKKIDLGKKSRQFSAGTTTADTMSRSVPAQGEMAATAVEEAERRVDALEQALGPLGAGGVLFKQDHGR